MFETLSYLALQHYWWFLISLIAAFLVFMLFVQGGQTLIHVIARNNIEESLIINSLGRKWEFTFTTLVVFGGSLFAAFPMFYSTSFGGAYWLWMSILFCFVIQAVSYEYRSKPNNFLGKNTFDIFLLINGILGTFLLGVAVATMFTGGNFIIDPGNIANHQAGAISQWMNPWHGLEALMVWQNFVFGLSVFFLSRTLALLYFLNNIDNNEIALRSRKHLTYNSLFFVLFFLIFLVSILTSLGYSYEPTTKQVFLEKYKFFNNFIEMPFIAIVFLIGLFSFILGIVISIFKNSTKGIWYSGTGVILVVFSIFIILGYNNTCFYPSKIDFQSSLTIENSSSSYFTLTVMSYASILLPFVIAYIYYAWKSINNKRIDKSEIEDSEHVY
jgi:cytochrome d ubiquinol oxidase subunit II